MTAWSSSVRTQGIRIRQRALSSTAPEKVVKRRCYSLYQTTDSPAMNKALDELFNMNKEPVT